jgi:glycosyltransferase involved in cell wall biosynthesis
MTQVFAYRKRLGRDAELCVLPQQARLRQFIEAVGREKPAFCVWNCPRSDEIPKVAGLRTDQAGELLVYYHGSINSARLPESVIVAASRLRGAVRVQVAGYESPDSIGYVQKLIKLAEENGLPGLIEPLGTIPLRKDLLGSAAKAQLGLSLMPMNSQDINLAHMVGASNKPFDYMACGLPLLVTDLPEWVSGFVEPGYGRACDPDDADSIEAALRWYLDHPRERLEMGRRCREKIRRDWNYETMFAGVLAELEGACEGFSHRPRLSTHHSDSGRCT